MRFILIFLALAFCLPVFSQESKTAITRVNIVDVVNGRILDDQTVVIHGERIYKIIPSVNKENLKKYTIIDAGGKYLIPGLIETHIHLHNYFKNNYSQPVSVALNFMLMNGVTAFREASGSVFTKELLMLRDSINAGLITGPKMYVSAITTGTNLKKHSASSYTELVTKFKEMGVDGIKVKFTTAKETKEIIDQAHKLELPVYGHTANSIRNETTNVLGDFTQDIVDYGIDGVMHSTGYPPIGSSKIPPMPSGWKEEDWEKKWLYNDALWLYVDTAAENKLIEAMVRKKTWLEPTLTINEMPIAREMYKDSRYAPYMYDEFYLGFPNPEGVALDTAKLVLKRESIFIKKFHDAGGLILAGTDMFPGISLHRELELLVEAGLSAAEALKTATYNNAKALGWERELGSIQEGKIASLVLLKTNPLENISNTQKIEMVFLKGRIIEIR